MGWMLALSVTMMIRSVWFSVSCEMPTSSTGCPDGIENLPLLLSCSVSFAACAVPSIERKSSLWNPSKLDALNEIVISWMFVPIGFSPSLSTRNEMNWCCLSSGASHETTWVVGNAACMVRLIANEIDSSSVSRSVMFDC